MQFGTQLLQCATFVDRQAIPPNDPKKLYGRISSPVFSCLENDDFKNVFFHRVLFKLKQGWLQNLLSITYQEKS